MSQMAVSVAQASSISASSQNDPERASFGNASAEQYMLHSHAPPNAQFHNSQVHHSEVSMGLSSSSSTTTNTSLLSTASSHSLTSLTNTAHQRMHYITSSESILTSPSNIVSESAGAGNVNNSKNSNPANMDSLKNKNSNPNTSTATNPNTTNTNSQIMAQFETIDSSSVPSSTSLNPNQNPYVLLKCDPSVPPINYQDSPNTHPSVQQMQYDVSQQQQSRLSPFNEPNQATGKLIN